MKQALKCDFTWADFKTNSDGMVPVVVQDAENDEVLMLAYMNEEAFETTLCLGKMTYWSSSRNELWTKGLSSGHVQYVKQLLIDCDNDTILAKVEQAIEQTRRQRTVSTVAFRKEFHSARRRFCCAISDLKLSIRYVPGISFPAMTSILLFVDAQNI